MNILYYSNKEVRQWTATPEVSLLTSKTPYVEI